MARENFDGKPLTVRLPAEDVEEIEGIAAALDREVAWVHRKLIREALTARRGAPPPRPESEQSPGPASRPPKAPPASDREQGGARRTR